MLELIIKLTIYLFVTYSEYNSTLWILLTITKTKYWLPNGSKSIPNGSKSPFWQHCKSPSIVLETVLFWIQAHTDTLRCLHLRVNCSRANTYEGPTTIRTQENNTGKTSNDIIAGNGRVLKFHLFIVWLYLFRKISMLMIFFLLMHHNVLHLMLVFYNIIYT